MWIKEGLSRIYKGKDAFSRQLALFSLCGILAILDLYFVSDGIESMNIIQIVLYSMMWLLFSMYIVGYEVLFLHERELPDLDCRPFKYIIKKPLIYFFLFTIPLIAAKFFPNYVSAAFLTEMLLAVPLTMVQAGYSYNFLEDEAYKFYENSSFKEYAILFLKRLGLFAVSYLIVSFVLFVLFFIFGFVAVIIYHGDVETIRLILSGNQFITEKLSNVFGDIFLMYLLTIATLIWDYELIKTYEKTQP